MNTDSNPWSSEFIESIEGREQINKIARQVLAQGGRELGIFIDRLMKVIIKKIIEAEKTRVEMKPTIEKDFGLNPDPIEFKNFLIDSMAQLGETIKRPDSPTNYYEPTIKFNEFFDSYIEQFDLLAERIDLDKILRAYGKWRINNHYRSEKWYKLYTVLINIKFMDTDTTFEVFNNVMQNKHLPASAVKIKLLASMVYAMEFQAMIKFTIPQMNECFKSKNGKLFHAKYRNKNMKYPPSDIIKKISDTLKA
jgi:hypothetical protein